MADKSETECYGLVKDPKTGKIRPCKRNGNSVKVNGFCTQHQFMALKTMLDTLKSLKSDLRLLKESEDVSITLTEQKLLEKKIDELVGDLKTKSDECELNDECNSCLQNVIVSLKEMIEPGGIPVMNSPQASKSSPIVSISNKLNKLQHLASSGGPLEAVALRSNNDAELYRRQNHKSDNSIQKLQNDLHLSSSDSLQQEKLFRNGLENLTFNLNQVKADRDQCKRVIQSLEKRQDRCHAERAQADALYSSTITEHKNSESEYKSLFEKSKSKQIESEIALDKYIENEKKLHQSMAELKLKYEEELKNTQDSFAKLSENGGVILSVREEELQEEISVLKKQLTKTMDNLQMSTNLGKQALQKAINPVGGHKQLVVDLQTLNDMVKRKDREIQQLSSEADKNRRTLYDLEGKLADNVERATVSSRKHVQELNQSIRSLEGKLKSTRNEYESTETKLFNKNSEFDTMVQSMKNTIRQKEIDLDRIRKEKEESQMYVKNYTNDAQKVKMDYKRQLDLAYDQKLTLLEETTQHKIQILKDYKQRNDFSIEKEKADLKRQRDINNLAQERMEEQSKDLENYRNLYEAKMAEFETQASDLRKVANQAEIQNSEFTNIINGYKNRINVANQTTAVHKQRSEAKMQYLSSQLMEAENQKQRAVVGFQQCQTARDTISQTVRNLSQNNVVLKDRNLQLQSEIATMKARFESTMAKIKAEGQQFYRSANECNSLLSEASLAHADVQRMSDDVGDYRSELRKEKTRAKDAALAVQRTMKDRDIAKERSFNLENSLKDVHRTSANLESQLKNANHEKHQLKQMNDELQQQLRNSSSDYNRAIQTREADMAREKFEKESKENMLKKQLAELQVNENELQTNVKNLKQQRNVTQDLFIDSQIQNANRLDLLVKSNQLTNPDNTIVGQSSLTTT